MLGTCTTYITITVQRCHGRTNTTATTAGIDIPTDKIANITHIGIVSYNSKKRNTRDLRTTLPTFIYRPTCINPGRAYVFSSRNIGGRSISVYMQSHVEITAKLFQIKLSRHGVVSGTVVKLAARGVLLTQDSSRDRSRDRF